MGGVAQWGQGGRVKEGSPGRGKPGQGTLEAVSGVNWDRKSSGNPEGY